jgi:hypothetical protein
VVEAKGVVMTRRYASEARSRPICARDLELDPGIVTETGRESGGWDSI